MNWSDNGIVLSTRAHGEHSAVVSLLTEHHGRHAGLVRGARGKRLSGVLQQGNEVAANWRARLAEHLGSYTVELSRARAAHFMDRPKRLAALVSGCALTDQALAERESHPAVYFAFQVLLDALETPEVTAETAAWPAVYVRYELGLLQELGYGLDLSTCAATGTTEDLCYVSPRSARAVSRAAGAAYHDKMLPLPAFLLGRNTSDVSPQGITDGLRLTGYFLERGVIGQGHGGLPEARSRLVALLKT